jgi:hypothetical protein
VSSRKCSSDCDLGSEHAEVAHRNASAVARERLGSDDDARHEHHDNDVEGAAGECIPGSTSLVDGEACTVRVLFSPSRREVLTGPLTISSPLAGATELPLAGRGIVPPLLVVERENSVQVMASRTSAVSTNCSKRTIRPPLTMK